MDTDEARKLREAVEAAHRRTDTIDRRVAVMESQFADLRADVRALAKQSDNDSKRLERIATIITHMSETVDKLSGRVWTQMAGGGAGGAGLAYIVLQVMGQ